MRKRKYMTLSVRCQAIKNKNRKFYLSNVCLVSNYLYIRKQQLIILVEYKRK